MEKTENNEDDFGTKVKTWISKGAKASKDAIEKAGDKVQDFTDKSVLKIEKKQLENKRENCCLELGKKVYQLLSSDLVIKINNESDKKEIISIQKEIKSIDKQIAEKEKEINS